MRRNHGFYDNNGFRVGCGPLLRRLPSQDSERQLAAELLIAGGGKDSVIHVTRRGVQERTKGVSFRWDKFRLGWVASPAASPASNEALGILHLRYEAPVK